jgi:putative transposase
MADESNTGTTIEAVETDAPAKAPVPKKQRAPRRAKATAEATTATTVAKTPRERRKSTDEGVDATLASVKKQVAGKTTSAVKTGSKKTSKLDRPKASPSVSAIDDMADLIQLEEENKKLRKTLADKLRTENSELRRRLGLD